MYVERKVSNKGHNAKPIAAEEDILVPGTGGRRPPRPPF
jgi:hypothetical protein